MFLTSCFDYKLNIYIVLTHILKFISCFVLLCCFVLFCFQFTVVKIMAASSDAFALELQQQWNVSTWTTHATGKCLVFINISSSRLRIKMPNSYCTAEICSKRSNVSSKLKALRQTIDNPGTELWIVYGQRELMSDSNSSHILSDGSAKYSLRPEFSM